MWEALTEKDLKEIECIYTFFSGKFPDVSEEELKSRIYNGYCWGEGGIPIISIEDWNDVFNCTKIGKAFLTYFESWEDYRRYSGDYHQKLKA